jgi:hypothetical protein
MKIMAPVELYFQILTVKVIWKTKILCVGSLVAKNITNRKIILSHWPYSPNELLYIIKQLAITHTDTHIHMKSHTTVMSRWYFGVI